MGSLNDNSSYLNGTHLDGSTVKMGGELTEETMVDIATYNSNFGTRIGRIGANAASPYATV